MPKILSADLADDVRDEDLLAQPDDESADAEGKVVERDEAACQLVGDVAVPDDRAGDELRKEEQVERRVHRTLLCGRIMSVDVHDVGDRVKRDRRRCRSGAAHAAPQADRSRLPRAAELTLSTKKLAYLKTPSTIRLTLTAAASTRLALSALRARATAIAIR